MIHTYIYYMLLEVIRCSHGISIIHIYEIGSLEVIHHGPDGQPLPPVPLDELPPPNEPKPRRGTSGQKRKQR